MAGSLGVVVQEGKMELPFPAGHGAQVLPALGPFHLETDGFCSASGCSPRVVENRINNGLGAETGI